VRKMGELGIPPARVEAVFLTHFHSDHFDGLGELMLQRWAGGAHKAPMPVYGPQGVDKIVEGLEMAYAQDRDYRIDHHGETIVPPSGFGGEPIVIGSEPLMLGDLKVTLFQSVMPLLNLLWDTGLNIKTVLSLLRAIRLMIPALRRR